MNSQIKESTGSDFKGISDVAMAAFGAPEGPEIVNLIADLLADESAQPLLSFVATVNKMIVGHILFTGARLDPAPKGISAAILAPLSVHPDFQSRGIGGKLVTEGLQRLLQNGFDLVFVLGHPTYYPKFGFSEAGVNGFEAPYPILPKNKGAWMVQELHPGIIGRVAGRVVCANSLDDPKYWREQT